MNRIIVLNNIERDLAVAGGTARYNQNKDNDIPGDKGLKGDIRGMAGEIAVCKFYNKYPDLRIGPNKLGHDLTLGELRVDVKTTKYVTGYLDVSLKHKPTSNFIYILVTAEDPHYKMVGWQWSDYVIQEANYRDGSYKTEQDTLRHMDELNSDFKKRRW